MNFHLHALPIQTVCCCMLQSLKLIEFLLPQFCTDGKDGGYCRNELMLHRAGSSCTIPSDCEVFDSCTSPSNCTKHSRRRTYLQWCCSEVREVYAGMAECHNTEDQIQAQQCKLQEIKVYVSTPSHVQTPFFQGFCNPQVQVSLPPPLLRVVLPPLLSTC